MLEPRVLFVEDNFFCNMESCEFLRENGFIVIPAYCALAALEVIRRHERISALVTDIDLGPGRDGFEVARYARAAYPDLPVVYISSAERLRYAPERVAGAQFISKPYHPRQIIEALGRATHLEAA
jgi:CheY-like chemotaxis protein